MSLNPLSAGRSFQTETHQADGSVKKVLIPYQQGGLFRLSSARTETAFNCLNPLSAGRSFQTCSFTVIRVRACSLNPLSAGRSFQTLMQDNLIMHM